MAFVWIQSPTRPGDDGKRYVTEEKAALLELSGWTPTTPPDGAPSPVPGDTPVTHDELAAALAGLGAGSTPDATSTTKGKVRIMDGTADNPLYPASRITGQLQPLQLPPLAIIDYLGAVASQSAMLALPGQKGDWCVRTDTGKGWIITGSDPTQLSSWTILPYPAATMAGLTDLDSTGAATGTLVAVGGTGPTSYKLMHYFKTLAKDPDNLVEGTVTRDGNGAATSAPVVWPDGTPGTYTGTPSSGTPGAIDAYAITYGSPVTRTYSQPAVTRDASGAVTARPAIVVA